MLQLLLQQNHPNPYYDATRLRCAIPYDAEIDLSVFDAMGRKVKTLVAGRQLSGSYEANLDAAGMDPGVYFCRLQAGTATKIQKMLLMK